MSETVTSDRLYGLLVAKLSDSPDWQERVNAHVKAVGGHPLSDYHANGAAEADKVVVYRTCLRAIMTKDTSLLKNGDEIAPAKEQEEAKAPLEVPLARIEPIKVAQHATNPAGRLQEALREFIGQPKADIDEAAVKAIVDAQVLELDKSFKKAIAEAFAAKAPTITFIIDGKSPVEVTGATHWQLPQLATWLQAGVPTWAWGGAGAGKTHLGRQLGLALGLPVTIISIDPTMTVGKLMGYRNLATGDFVEGFFYKPFRNGGLVMLDEIDTGDPGILACANALVSNGHYLFPNGETVERHKDFRILAGANTKGAGAVAGYTARNRLDAATLDRFAIIELEYDPALEMALATGQPKEGGKVWVKGKPAGEATIVGWVNYVQKARAQVGTSVLISPRASYNGAAALRAGIPVAEVADAVLFKLCTPDTKRAILSQCGDVTRL